MNSKKGRVTQSNFRKSIQGEDKAGHLTFGPYATLPSGEYEMKIEYISSLSTSEIAGYWDIVSLTKSGSKILKRDNISGTNKNSMSVVSNFTWSELHKSKIEIRSFYNGVGDLTIKSLTIQRIK